MSSQPNRFSVSDHRQSHLGGYPGSGVEELSHGYKRDKVVRHLLQMILNGQYHGGQRIVTESIAKECGVSHTPVREALGVLAGMGLLSQHPNRSATVRQLTRQDIREISQVRVALECLAVRLSVSHLDRAKCLRLWQRFDELMDCVDDPTLVAKAIELDSTFHDMIAEACGNQFLQSELKRLKGLFRALRDLAWQAHVQEKPSLQRVHQETKEHRLIMHYLLAGDGRMAARAMARHIKGGIHYWMKLIPRTGESQRDRALEDVQSTPSAGRAQG